MENSNTILYVLTLLKSYYMIKKEVEKIMTFYPEHTPWYSKQIGTWPGNYSNGWLGKYQLHLKGIFRNEIERLKDFQFKINNKILVTKSFLHKIKIIVNNTCSLCREYPETIKHLFFECEKAKQFWNLFKEWLNRVANITVDVNNEKMILFSWHKRNLILNYLLDVAKYYIYKSKFAQENISILGFKAILKKAFEEEKYIAKINDKYAKFLGKW